jgi:hypothetical protein
MNRRLGPRRDGGARSRGPAHRRRWRYPHRRIFSRQPQADAAAPRSLRLSVKAAAWPTASIHTACMRRLRPSPAGAASAQPPHAPPEALASPARTAGFLRRFRGGSARPSKRGPAGWRCAGASSCAGAGRHRARGVRGRAYRGRTVGARGLHRASTRLSLRLTPTDKANLRQLAAAHQLGLGAYLVACGLGRLRPGVDEMAELRAQLEQLERRMQELERVAGRGY